MNEARKGKAPALKSMTFHDEISIRIPEHWACEFTENLRWVCFDQREEEENFCFWVDFHTYTPPKNFSDDFIPQYSNDLLKKMKQEKNADGGDYLEIYSTKMKDGFLIFFLDQSADEDGRPITIYTWRRFKAHQGQMALAFFNLVVVTGTMPASEEKDLVQLMKNEVKNAEVGFSAIN